MLNSINCEKKTLLYYFIGESGLILSIYFLPKFLGAGSLIAGYYFSFTVSALLNLRLLDKKCNEHIGYKRFLLAGFLFLIPSTLLGVFLRNIFITRLTNFPTIIVSTIIVTIFNLLFYIVFGFIKIKIVFICSLLNSFSTNRASISMQIVCHLPSTATSVLYGTYVP